ncbi:MAG: MOSC domain-containing protein [Lachnospiraceae bacterium]|nr:MOSC domain-containing protein [Lachnospiraceae bacterium]
MIMGVIKGICISDIRGIQKKEVGTACLVEDWGLQEDAHAGHWHRQVSLLSFEKIEEFRKRGANVDFGAFGENIIVEGYDFKTLPIGTRFRCGTALLEMTQIGKECHSHCEIYKIMGDCIMPREGVFTKVLEGGPISVGDEFVMVEA